MQDAVGNGGDGGAVGNEESGAAFPRTVQKQTKQRPFALGVHLRGRFVGEEDSGVVHECDGEARASKFAARELVGERLRAPGQADRLKSGIYVGASARLTGKEERRKHVVFESEVVLQVSGLQEYAGMLRPESGLLGLRLAGHPLTADGDPPAIRVIKPGEAIDKGRLAASGWADERHCLACGDRERNPAQRERFVVAYVVETIEIVGLERLRHPSQVKLREICRQTSTLSDPAGAESERTASFPSLKYS